MSEGDKATECIVYLTHAPVASRNRALKALKNWGKIEDEEMREFTLKQFERALQYARRFEREVRDE